jgi:hypothetical protein
VELPSLDAWLLAGEPEETCEIEPARGTERLVLVRIRADAR